MTPPPLFVVAPISGSTLAPRLRRVNPLAVDYLQGRPLAEVYPEDTAGLRALAPPPGGPDAAAFVAATGLPYGEVYPPSGALTKPRGFRWGATAAGLVAGALVGWPWPLVGAGTGLLIDAWRGRGGAR